MDNDLNQKFFILIGFKKISFVALNSKNEFSFQKEILLNDDSIKENY